MPLYENNPYRPVSGNNLPLLYTPRAGTAQDLLQTVHQDTDYQSQSPLTADDRFPEKTETVLCCGKGNTHFLVPGITLKSTVKPFDSFNIPPYTDQSCPALV
jgi:hypothetical protein